MRPETALDAEKRKGMVDSPTIKPERNGYLIFPNSLFNLGSKTQKASLVGLLVVQPKTSDFWTAFANAQWAISPFSEAMCVGCCWQGDERSSSLFPTALWFLVGFLLDSHGILLVSLGVPRHPKRSSLGWLKFVAHVVTRLEVVKDVLSTLGPGLCGKKNMGSFLLWCSLGFPRPKNRGFLLLTLAIKDETHPPANGYEASSPSPDQTCGAFVSF